MAFAALKERAANESAATSIFDRVLHDGVAPYHRSIFRGDRMLAVDKSAGFRDDPWLKVAMRAIAGSVQYDQYPAPDGVAWRFHTLLWAARCGLRVPGDFVECGEYKGDFA